MAAFKQAFQIMVVILVQAANRGLFFAPLLLPSDVVKPNGQTKQISGQTAAGYNLEISMPSAMPGSKDMDMTVTLQGPVWIVKDAPGAADYNGFYKAAVEKGWIFSVF